MSMGSSRHDVGAQRAIHHCLCSDQTRGITRQDFLSTLSWFRVRVPAQHQACNLDETAAGLQPDALEQGFQQYTSASYG